MFICKRCKINVKYLLCHCAIHSYYDNVRNLRIFFMEVNMKKTEKKQKKAESISAEAKKAALEKEIETLRDSFDCGSAECGW